MPKRDFATPENLGRSCQGRKQRPAQDHRAARSDRRRDDDPEHQQRLRTLTPTSGRPSTSAPPSSTRPARVPPGRRLTRRLSPRSPIAVQRTWQVSDERDHAPHLASTDPLVAALEDRGLLDLVVARAAEHRVTVADIVGRARTKTITRARHAVMRDLYSLGLSSVEVGTLLGRDHTTVLAALAKTKCAVDTTRRGAEGDLMATASGSRPHGDAALTHERCTIAEVACPGAMGLYLFLVMQARHGKTHNETLESPWHRGERRGRLDANRRTRSSPLASSAPRESSRRRQVPRPTTTDPRIQANRDGFASVSRRLVTVMQRVTPVTDAR